MSRHQRTLLSGLKTLTFYADEWTAHRRSSAVPQLSCQGATCKLYTPDVIQCYNQGGSGTDVQWKCEADLPSSIKLGRVQVSCEGWDRSDDPYILKGSCGLEYTLKRVTGALNDHNQNISTMTAWLFWGLFIGVALFILWPFLRSALTTLLPFLDPFMPGRPGGPGGGGGGPGPRGGGNRRFWGGGTLSDPPPPYTPRGQPKPTSTGSQESSWRPGFWTGAAAGAAARHLFGGTHREPTYGYDFDRSPFTARPAGLFGGGLGPVQRSSPLYRGQGNSRDLDEGSSLGSIRSSTGYGGTRNR